MECTREGIAEKIQQLLDRSLTPRQVYEWALGVAVSHDYEALSRQDLVAEQAVKILMRLSEDIELQTRELKILEYLRQCLRGEREYIPLEENPSLPDLSPLIISLWGEVARPVDPLKVKIVKAVEIYVYIFAGWVILFNLWMLFRLGGPWSYRRVSAVWTFPFFFYGFMILVFPMRIFAADKVFWASLSFFILVAGYFWLAVFRSLTFIGLSFFSSLFLGAIPASFLIGLLIYEKYFKAPRAEREKTI